VWVSGFYLLGLLLLGMHLSHGISSVFQTFGLNGRKSARLIKHGALFVSWALMLGFASIPVASVAGYLQVLPEDRRVAPEPTASAQS
jgi:succinate dehydrogenase / fumarate reductase cytochrome b subunit